MKGLKPKDVLLEASRLYDLGFAILWLRPKSKQPFEKKWTSGNRRTWKELRETYGKGMNLGVRLGTPSKIGGKYLACIDLDLKSTKTEHLTEALSKLKSFIGDLKFPQVQSGRGGGSAHFYFLTEKPFKTFTPSRSADLVKVLMPSKSPSRRELETLTKKELNEGYRFAAAWEISFYSDGRQVVLPPSTHPDTGRAYEWSQGLKKLEDLPTLDVESFRPEKEGMKNERGSNNNFDGSFPGVDLAWVDGIPDRVRQGITKGEGVTDRSAYLMTAGMALLRAGLSKEEILSVLTDQKYFLGEVGFDHTKSNDRRRAAEWVWKYSLRKVFEEKDAALIFEKAAHIESVVLSDEDAKKQAEEIEKETDWTQKLERSGRYGDGPPKNNLANLVLILSNAIGDKIFERNTFAMRDTYGMDTPWGGKKGALLTDDDVPKLALWVLHHFEYQPSKDCVYDAFVVIACNNAFDPVQDWLNALPKWDGRPRLYNWLEKNFEARGTKDYLAQVFTKWIGAMVIRTFEPGAKFDWVPIFEGAQGAGKSSFGRILAGDKYFLDWVGDLQDKDSAANLQGIWTVELGELAALKRNEIEITKAYITRTVDKFRPAYGRRTVELPRRCVFFGTTNRGQYLVDQTGNRRFKPIEVGQLNFAALERDREHLFAEALAKYRSGELRSGVGLELTGDAKEFEQIMHSKKIVEDDSDFFRDKIEDFFEQVFEGKNETKIDPKKFRVSTLFNSFGPLETVQANARNLAFAAIALTKMGATMKRSNGKSLWTLHPALDDF